MPQVRVDAKNVRIENTPAQDESPDSFGSLFNSNDADDKRGQGKV